MPDHPAAIERFLADENFPGASVRLLRSLGYDIAVISEIAPGTDDLGVIAIARREQRLLLTLDRDHGQLVFVQHAPPPPGIVHFRMAQQTPQDPALYLLALLTDPRVTLRGQYTVIRRERHIGQRPLPGW